MNIMPIDDLVRGRGGEGKCRLHNLAQSEEQGTACYIATVFIFKYVTRDMLERDCHKLP